jgi:hypothetical protein
MAYHLVSTLPGNLVSSKITKRVHFRACLRQKGVAAHWDDEDGETGSGCTDSGSVNRPNPSEGRWRVSFRCTNHVVLFRVHVQGFTPLT